jgi:taurine dioxygenase
LSDGEFSELHRLWQARGVLLVRGQAAMSDAQFEAFSARFGELDPPPNQGVGRKSVPGHPNLYVVSNEVGRTGEPLGALGNGEAVWHTDMSYLPVPPIASMLLARKLPANGGNTWIAGMCAAYENLPPALKKRVKHLRIKHDGTRDSGGNVRQGVADDPNPVTSKGHPHPAVIRDPGTGRPALFLGRRPRAYVLGLPLEESEALLDEL